MFAVSVNPWISHALATDLIAALSARPAGALLTTPFVKLFTAVSANPNPYSAVADFTEATFTGYAGQACTLPLIGPINVTGSTIAGLGNVNFVAGSGITPPGQTILGYYVVDDNAAPTKVYMSELFPSPIPIVNPGDAISLDVLFAADENPLLQ